MGEHEFERIREIALGLPEVNERFSHGAPCFFFRDKRPICYFHGDHTGDGRVSIWCPAPPGVQEELVESAPERFFRPTPSTSGVFARWVGVYIDAESDGNEDWHEVTAILEDALRLVAPKSIAAQLDNRS